MSLADASARGARSTFVGQMGKFALQVLSTLLLARLLNESDFGLYAMVIAVAGLAALLSDFGLSLAAVRAHDATPGQRSNMFWLNALLGLVAALAVFLLAGVIAAAYGDPAVAAIARAIAPLYFLQALLSQFYAESARQMKFGLLAASEVSAQAAGLIVAVTIAVLGGGHWALVAQTLVVASLNLLIIVPLAGWLPGRPRRGEPMRDLLTFAGNSAGVQILNYASSNVDTFVLGRTWGPAVTGVYSQAFQLFKVPLQQLAAPMTRVAVPVLAKVDSPQDFQRFVVRAQLALVYLLVGAFMAAGAVAEPLIALLLGPGWEAAPLLFTILTFGGIFQALGYVYYWVLLAKALTGIQLRVAIISRSLMILLIIFGVAWGATGVAIASSVGLAINWLLLTLIAVPRSGLRIRPLLLTGARPLIAYFAAFSITFTSERLIDGALPAVASLALLLIIFLASCSLFLLLPIYRTDVAELVDIIKRMGRK